VRSPLLEQRAPTEAAAGVAWEQAEPDAGRGLAQGRVGIREALSGALGPFAVSRLLLVGVTGVLVLLGHRSPLQLWSQWDGRWYLGIATHGYHWSLDGKPAVAFFPLYPLLVHLGTPPGLPEALTGLVLSSAAFLGALVYLYHLAALEWGPVAARKCVWLLALFPTAFFTFAPYTEGLWLLCAGGALYHARRGHALMAGVWVAAAVLTRSTGIVLLPPALIALGRIRYRSWALVIAPPVCGLGAYAAYLVSQHLSLLEVLQAQRAWHRALAFPWTGFTASVVWLSRHAPANMLFAVEDLLQLSVAVLFLALTLAAWRHFDRPTEAYCAGFWLVVLSSPAWLDGFYAPFNSVDRFVLALFPLAGWAAHRASPHRFRLALGVSGALMVASSAVHLSGGWVG
jgi:hypothetical protein